jgi:hypothetical protein
MSNRSRNRTRGVKATRKRTAQAIRSETNVVAFARTEDAHALTGNANSGKRHAARANVNVHTDPAAARRARVIENEGRRAHGEKMTTRWLDRTWAGLPSLPPVISKRATAQDSTL